MKQAQVESRQSEVTVSMEQLFSITNLLSFNCSKSNVLIGRQLFLGAAVLDAEMRTRERVIPLFTLLKNVNLLTSVSLVSALQSPFIKTVF